MLVFLLEFNPRPASNEICRSVVQLVSTVREILSDKERFFLSLDFTMLFRFR